jgi:hypothetical protein
MGIGSGSVSQPAELIGGFTFVADLTPTLCPARLTIRTAAFPKPQTTIEAGYLWQSLASSYYIGKIVYAGQPEKPS